MPTYYVDNVNGSDSNSGTSAASPVRTWNAAAIGSGTFNPGDVLLFKSGVVYDGSVGRVAPAFSATPTSTEPFLVSIYGGDLRAILDGGGIRDIGFRPAVAIDQANGPNYVTVENLEIRYYCSNAINFGETSATGIHLNGSTLKNLFVHDITHTSQPAMVSWGTDFTIENCIVDNVAGDGIYIEGARYLVRSTQVSRVSNTGAGAGDCIQINQTSSHAGIVEYCHLDHTNNSDKQALLLMGNSSIARFNTILGPSVGAGSLTVDRSGWAQIYGNTFSSRDGIYLLDSVGPCEVYGNVIICSGKSTVAGDSNGIDSNATGHSFWNNTIVGFHRGILGQGQTVRNNIITQCSDVAIYAGTGVTESYNNLFGNARTIYNNIASTHVPMHSTDTINNPGFDQNYRPMNAQLRSAGIFLGGVDVNGNEFQDPPTLGGMQFPFEYPPNDLSTPQIVTLATLGLNVSAKSVIKGK